MTQGLASKYKMTPKEKKLSLILCIQCLRVMYLSLVNEVTESTKQSQRTPLGLGQECCILCELDVE